jgi:hypothetical protein
MIDSFFSVFLFFYALAGFLFTVLVCLILIYAVYFVFKGIWSALKND